MPVQKGEGAMRLQFVKVLTVFLWLAIAGGTSGADPSPGQAPQGHESSSGVGIVGGGFITATGIWVTPGLTGQPYYRQWIPQPETRDAHRRAAASYTLILLELGNHSALRIDGYLSLNVRLLVDGEHRRPAADPMLARTYPGLAPEQNLERVAPGQTLVKVYAFPKVEPSARSVALIIRPLWLFRGHSQVGHLPDFELRFSPARLSFPP